MAAKPKYPMPVSQRAKQFMPFSALKGLEEALEKKERLALSKSLSSPSFAPDFSSITKGPSSSSSPEDIPRQ